MADKFFVPDSIANADRSLRRTGSLVRGFTLLEVLVALCIIGILSGFWLVSTRSVLVGNDRSQAFGRVATAIKEVVETAAIVPLSTIDSWRSAPVEVPSSQPQIKVWVQSRAVKASDVGGSAVLARLNPASLRHLTLVAKFSNSQGTEAARTFTTIVFKP